jgi:flagella basal body P-ring formation protein FlgA
MSPTLKALLLAGALSGYSHVPASSAAGTGQKGPIAVITFQPSAEVSGRTIRLSDIAAVEGESTRLVSRLGEVEVGAAPLCGHSRMVSAQYAKIRVRQIGVDVNSLVFGGSELVTVTRPDQRVPGDAIEKAACEAVEAANPGTTAQATFRLGDLRLPLGAVQIKPAVAQTSDGVSGSLPVQVLVDGQPEASVTVSYRLLRRAPTVVSVHDLPLNAVVTGEDLRVEERPVLPGPQVLSDLSLVVGQQVTVPIKGGTPVTRSMLKPAILIRRGTRVRLICRGPTFTATAAGEALQDAIWGQPVRVRNLSSLKELTGLATDAETVEVPF